MYYLIYKTTNLINGKIYIGKHKSDTLEFDGYYGSGKLLYRSILKYGSENFKREILYVFDNENECFEKEREIVNSYFCERQDTYNISIGGSGGNTLYAYTETEKKEIYKKRGLSIKQVKNKMTDKMRVKYRDHMKKIRIQPDNKGRKHTGIQLNNITNANKMCGKNWITDGNESYLIDLDMENIPEGFYLGRTFTDDKKFKGHKKEILQKLSNKRKSGKYYNNGEINIYIHLGEEIPKGFISGMKPREKKDKYSWYTNGIDNIGLYDGDLIPENYYKGRTLKNKNKGTK